jgi:hypothetical protein
MPIARNLKNENRRLHLVSIPYDKRLRDLYVPSDFSSDEYPNLLAAGETVETVAASVLLVALNFRKRLNGTKESRNSWMHCFPGLTNSRNRRATRNGRRRALLRSYLGGSGLRPRRTGSTAGVNKTTRLEKGRLPNSRTFWPMRGAQICPRKSYRNYSRSSSSGNDAPRTSLGCGRGGGCGRSTACPAMNVLCAKQGDVQSRLDET